jgi:hypothetical protein
MPLKNAFCSLSLVLISVSVFAQQPATTTTPDYTTTKNYAKRQKISQMMKMEQEGDLIFNHYWLIGIKLATNGYGLFYENGKFITTKRTRIINVELNEIKDPKDHKEPTYSSDGYSYNYVSVGRLNNFYELKASYGQQVLIGGKDNRNGVSVSYLYSGGLSLGMLKQYVLDVYPYPSPNTTIITSTYPKIFDSAYTVTDALGLGGGWNHLQFTPGVNAKLAMRFDYGRFNTNIAAIEAGVTGEYYTSKMPLMAYVAPKQLFFNAYVTIMFGKRK